MKNSSEPKRPEILAPAGNKASFLAALAAGADAVYCGLKQYSARMAAKNFSIDDLERLTRLAHRHDVRVYIALNALIQTAELAEAARLVDRLERQVRPDALIVQDLAFIRLARQVGFTGEIHLSTLANVSFPDALAFCGEKLGVQRVVVPRELNIDEIKAMAGACPEDFALEVFVHGALCYGVSGRCYWSSYLGGKSGLRGRCVQPCRRKFSQQGESRRSFSCQDLSLDVLVKLLLSVPQVSAWKIEGRKKGPHYVYYTVRAYRILRDLQEKGEKKAIAKKTALDLLAQALGRTGTHYNFLPQRPQDPVKPSSQTGSGLFLGKVQGSRQKPYLVPRQALLSGDTLRIGYEDEKWHAVIRVGRAVPKQGRFHLNVKASRTPARGAPVFLTDRREKALDDMLMELDTELSGIRRESPSASTLKPPRIGGVSKTGKVFEITVSRSPGRLPAGNKLGLWLKDVPLKSMSRRGLNQVWWWLPPVVWPQNEGLWRNQVLQLIEVGAVRFVLNMPWQISWFKNPEGLQLWAGPFCNLANGLAAAQLKEAGFSGVIVSPELGGDAILRFPKECPIPAGIVIEGMWPLCVSRTIAENFKAAQPFVSPRGEQAWVQKNGTEYWVFPNWKLDLTTKRQALIEAGYQALIRLNEPIPAIISLKKRPGLWNWKVGLK